MKPAARRRVLLLAALVLVAAAGAVIHWLPPPMQGTTGPPPLTYVGARSCAECHAEEAKRWRGSHHDLAMQEANDRTILGDFDDALLRG
jgi:hypothetical protein